MEKKYKKYLAAIALIFLFLIADLYRIRAQEIPYTEILIFEPDKNIIDVNEEVTIFYEIKDWIGGYYFMLNFGDGEVIYEGEELPFEGSFTHSYGY